MEIDLSADLFSGKIRRLIGTAEFCNEQTSAFFHSIYRCLGFSHIFFSLQNGQKNKYPSICHRILLIRFNESCRVCSFKNNIGLKTLLQQGILEPIFYGDLVYKLKRFFGKSYFSDQFKKIVKRYITVGYTCNLDIMRQPACLVLNPITVYSYGFLLNCMTFGQASDSMTALTYNFNR